MLKDPGQTSLGQSRRHEVDPPRPADACRDESMSRRKTMTPKVAQTALAEVAAVRVEDDRTPGLTDTKREIAKERLAEPRRHVGRGEFLAMLRRYGPTI